MKKTYFSERLSILLEVSLRPELLCILKVRISRVNLVDVWQDGGALLDRVALQKLNSRLLLEPRQSYFSFCEG